MTSPPTHGPLCIPLGTYDVATWLSLFFFSPFWYSLKLCRSLRCESGASFFANASSLLPLPSEVVAAVGHRHLYDGHTPLLLFRARMLWQDAPIMMHWSSLCVVSRASCDIFLSPLSLSSLRASLCGRWRFCLPRSPLGIWEAG